MRRGLAGLIALAAVSATVAALASSATATTLPETTYFVNVTLTDSKVILAPLVTVKPGSLVVFTVRNKSARPRNLVFGPNKLGFMAPGKHEQFELNFLVPWAINATSVERGGKHRTSARFICSW